MHRLAAHPPTVPLVVGPKRHLAVHVRHLLLPGIEGMSEDEVVHLFTGAHRRFAPRPAG